MNKKILYYISRLEQKRAFENIYYETNNNTIMLLGPGPRTLKNNHFEIIDDYSEFKTKNVTIDGEKDHLGAVTSFCPDALACSGVIGPLKVSLSPGCKKIHVGHGLIGDNYPTIDNIMNVGPSWNGYDLYCGAGHDYNEFMKFVCKQGYSGNFIPNALPQLDILYYGSKKTLLFKEHLLTRGYIPTAKKYILFAGFGGPVTSEYRDHNDDFYRTAIHLHKLANKNDWYIFIKTRLTQGDYIKFMNDHGELHKYRDEFTNLCNSNRVCVINKLDPIYKYFFVDIIILNGTSTIEVEASCINKPIIIVRTNSSYDPLKTITLNAAKLVNKDDMNNLEEAITSNFDNNIACQKKLLSYQNIIFDGQHSKRTQDAISLLLEQN